ncbi:MAG: GntR family transcriptional regulator [Chloroflexi bacterium]|nr:GntR family transcriptional regulator [Chloroflexota bacterium]
MSTIAGKRSNKKLLNMDVPVRNTSLADQVFSVLIDRITDEIYPAGSQLPTENELATEFSVSRDTIRAAVFRLEDRRIIHRKPGVGTYVSETNNISNPLNEFIEFSKLIEENGFKPGYIHVSSEIIVADKIIQNELQLSENEEVLKINKVFTANADPIIFVINHIPFWLIKDNISRTQVLDPDFTKDFKNFFEVVCNQQVSYFISQVRADLFDNINAPELMSVYQPQTPTLIIDQIGYNKADRPIISTIEYHPGNWMTFNVIRRWG